MRRCSLSLALTLTLVGCAPPNEYTISVKDPRLVTIERTYTPKTPADGAPTIASGTYDDKAWAIVTFREDDGALRLRCRACNKDAFLVGPDGVMHVTDDRDAPAIGLRRPSPLAVANGASVGLSYNYCGFSGKHGCRGGAWSGRRVTPWSNISEIRARKAPAMLGSPLVLGGAVLLGALGTTFLVGGIQSDAPGSQVGGVIGGGGLIALSAMFASFFIAAQLESVVDHGDERGNNR